MLNNVDKTILWDFFVVACLHALNKVLGLCRNFFSKHCHGVFVSLFVCFVSQPKNSAILPVLQEELIFCLKTTYFFLLPFPPSCLPSLELWE